MKRFLTPIIILSFVVAFVFAFDGGLGSWEFLIRADSSTYADTATHSITTVTATRAESLTMCDGITSHSGCEFLLSVSDTFGWLFGDSVLAQIGWADSCVDIYADTIYGCSPPYFYDGLMVRNIQDAGTGNEGAVIQFQSCYRPGVIGEGDTGYINIFIDSSLTEHLSGWLRIDGGNYIDGAGYRQGNILIESPRIDISAAGQWWNSTMDTPGYVRILAGMPDSAIITVGNGTITMDGGTTFNDAVLVNDNVTADTFFGVYGAVGNCQIIYAESLYSCSPIEVAATMRIDGGDLIVADGQKIIITDGTEADTLAFYHNGDAGYLSVDDYMVFRFGGVSKMNFNSSNMLPLTDGGINLGGDANSFGNLYIDGESFLGNNVVDTITFTGLSWFLANAWFPSGDTLWFVDATGADSNFITNDGSYLLFDGDNNISFDDRSIRTTGTIFAQQGGAGAISGTNDAGTIEWDGKWIKMDFDADDSLSGMTFGNTDSLVWDSIPEDFYITCGLWLPETLFFTDGRGGADTNWIVNDGSYQKFGGDNQNWFTGVVNFQGNIQASSDTTKYCGIAITRWKEVWALRHYGSSPDKADSFVIWDDGDTTYFDSDNPIKIGGASLVVGTNGLVTVDSLVARTSVWKYLKLMDAINLATGGSGATSVTPDTNTQGGYNLDANTEYLYFQGSCVCNWDGASDPWVGIIWECDVDNTLGADTDTVEFDLLVYLKGNGETANKTQTLNVRTEIGKSPRYKQFRSRIYIDYDSGTDPVDPGDILSMRLSFDEPNSDITDVVVNLLKFSYQTNVPQLKNY